MADCYSQQSSFRSVSRNKKSGF